MEIIKIESMEQFNEAIKSGKSIVKFYADWCGPCKMMTPFYKAVAEETKDVNFLEVNTDANQDIAIKYEIMSIPTLIVFENGELKTKFVGFAQKEKIAELIK